MFHKLLRNYIWWSTCFRKGDSKYCNFINTLTIRTYVQLENIIFWKLHVFRINIFPLDHNLILFSEKIVKSKRKCYQIFQNHLAEILFVTYSWDILRFNFKKPLDLDLKNFRLFYWARVNLMIYWTLNGKISELPYSTRIDFMTY